MNTNIPQDPKEIKEQLLEVCRDVYAGFIHGCGVVKEFFDAREREVNPSLAANIARYEAREFLHQKRNLLTHYLLENANNNGIAIRQDLYQIKVLKGMDGQPPCPSKARRSERFYSQGQPLLFKDMFKPWRSADWDLFVSNTAKLNLILCWEVDKSYSITRLQMMAPRQAWKYGQSVKLFWRQLIQHPASGIAIADLNQADDELEDLEIFFDEDAETGDE